MPASLPIVHFEIVNLSKMEKPCAFFLCNMATKERKRKYLPPWVLICSKIVRNEINRGTEWAPSSLPFSNHDVSQQERVFVCTTAAQQYPSVLVLSKRAGSSDDLQLFIWAPIHSILAVSLQCASLLFFFSHSGTRHFPLGLGCNWFSCKLRWVGRSADYLRVNKKRKDVPRCTHVDT